MTPLLVRRRCRGEAHYVMSPSETNLAIRFQSRNCQHSKFDPLCLYALPCFEDRPQTDLAVQVFAFIRQQASKYQTFPGQSCHLVQESLRTAYTCECRGSLEFTCSIRLSTAGTSSCCCSWFRWATKGFTSLAKRQVLLTGVWRRCG